MKHSTKLKLPFKGRWLTYWGGDNIKVNYHRIDAVQKYAFDFVGYDKAGKSFKRKGLKNEDYYVFGQDVLAPADGTVIEAVSGIRDNVPGQTNRFAVGGNYLLIEHTKHEYSFIAHLRQGSTLIKAGDIVKSGQKLGECGNSGNTSEPHIHYHLQDTDVHSIFSKTKIKPIAKGIKVFFADVELERDGKQFIKKQCSPVKGDIVSSAK
jgi:Peptidase family M23